MLNKNLTARQKEIFDLVNEEYKINHSFPSLSWIAKRVGIKTKRGVAIHLDALEKKGLINRNKQYFEIREQGSFPFLTGLAAGAPKEIFTDSENVSFGPDYFGRGDLVAVRVSGDSMSGDSIHDGDVVIINVSNLDIDQNILALRVDQSEMTLKRVKVETNKVHLISSNPNYSTITYSTERVEIVGKYVGLVRRSQIS